ncbi:unnamed protein product [Moneuplotes crassus]|uniref:Uncharacterized protein n=1 Tax=Euplotes crassus TaxID=5936 RepID=A0AAD1Y2E7_EUPCR|nr:unnamed protein product [Moneuplotes crassus]
MAGMLNKIDKDSIRQICSSQVVTDLKGAIKELVENSIDACAKKIDIKFFQYGLEGMEVADTGKGINEADFDIIAKRGTTSKISELEDIYKIKSLGFRGEALNSLCSLGEVSISTKTEDNELGYFLKFDEAGELISKKQIARNVGTTVSIKNLFRKLPVRYNEFKKTCKSQFTKALSGMQSYAIINSHIKFTLTNTTKGSKQLNTLIRTNGDGDMKTNIITIIGKKKTQELIEFECDLPHCKISGFVTKYISSGSMQSGKINRDSVHCYLNNRPIDLPKKIINCFMEIYKQFSAQVTPVIILNFQVEDQYYDINVSPDKREIFLKNEQEIIKGLKLHLNNFFEDIQKSKLVENLKKKEDSFNPTLDVKDNMIIKSLQKKKVIHQQDQMDEEEEEKFQARKDSGAQKSMSDHSQRFSQYKTNLRKRTSLQQSQGSSEGSKKIKSEVPRVKRLKTEYEIECENEELEDSSQKSTHKTEKKFTAFEPKRPSIDLEALKSRIKKNNTMTRQEKQKNFLSKFKAASKRGNRKRLSKEPEEESQQEEKPKDYMSAVERTFGPTQVKYLDKENDPAYELNQELMNHQEEQKTLFKREKIQLVNKNVSLDSNLNISSQGDQNIDITKESADPDSILREHPMNSEKLVFMEKLPVTTGFDTSDSEVSLDINRLPSILEREKQRYEELSSKKSENIIQRNKKKNILTNPGDLDNNIIDVDESKLDEMFGKEDFKKLRIIGQFNLGFILAVREDTNQLFILDQHATDEKFNFERLSKSTVIHSQPLVCPINHDVNVCELLALKEHEDVFVKNGFRFEFDNSDKETCNRIKIKTLPYSKNIQFTVDDFNELLSKITEDIDMNEMKKLEKDFLHKDIYRPKKVRNMLANRACRNSIMIGKALTKPKMKEIAINLSNLECPWNCPHGRPTMRFLIKLDDIPNSYEEFGTEPKILKRN